MRFLLSAMEVEHTDWARAQDRQSAESLLLTLESVLEEVRRMARVVAEPQEPRLRWRMGWGVVSAAMVCALVFTLVRLAPRVALARRPGARGERRAGSHEPRRADGQ